MKELVNLIKLDVITVKGKSLFPFLIIVLLVWVASIFTMPYFITCMAVFAGLAVQPIFIIAEQSGYNKLYGILPVKRHNIVLGRYAFGLILILATALVSIPLAHIAYSASLGGSFELKKDLSVIVSQWQSEGFTLELSAAYCFFMGCCLAAVEYALLFIFGTSKEISATFGFAIAFTVIVFVLIKVFNLDFSKLMHALSQSIANCRALSLVIYLSGILVMALGGLISSIFFCKREL